MIPKPPKTERRPRRPLKRTPLKRRQTYIRQHRKGQKSRVLADGREILNGPDWDRRRHERWELDERRCTECGRLLEFEESDCDHQIKRSKARDDRIENLRTKCRRCHDARHAGERKLQWSKPDASVGD